MKQVIYGIDLGGTSIKMGLFDEDGSLIDQFTIPTRVTNNGSNILPDIAEAINRHMEFNQLDRSYIKGVGIGVPGPVVDGVVSRCVNLGWGTVHVQKELEALLDMPVRVSNDANIAGLGEVWKGGGKGVKSSVFFTLGTGVGGAVIVDGKIIDGFVGAGGEVGHATIPFGSDILCNCGKMNCLETVASATGVVRLMKKQLEGNETPSILRGKSFEAKDVFDAAKKEDVLALSVIDTFGRNLGYICSVIAITTNPEIFVFGGGVSKAGNIITSIIKKYFKEYAFTDLRDVTQFKLATLGNEAGIYGAAYLVNIE